MTTLQLALQPELELKEQEWMRALQEQDQAAVSEVLHEQFTSTSARSCDVVRKREYLASIPRLHIRDWRLKDILIYTVENIGVAKTHLICDSIVDERDIHDDLLITDVWIKAGSVWKVVTRHASCTPG